MKKLALLFSISLLLFFINSCSESLVEKKKGWTKQERETFLSNCFDEAALGMSDSSAKEYCQCVLEKIQERYPKASDAVEMNKDEITEFATECVDMNSFTQWEEKDQAEFLDDCVSESQKTMTDENADAYCSCMLEKLMRKYPTPTSAFDAKTNVLEAMADDCRPE
jgi:hypothetical protein